jgi:uncharacterized repeat protein (TIGR02543 family)
VSVVKRILLPLALLSVLAFGVADAGGRSLAGSTVTVQVIGKGRVMSVGPSGIECGDGKKTCYLTFPQGAGQITLVPSDSATGWHFQNWAGCTSTSGDNCLLEGSSEYTVTAEFGGPATTTSTLSVSAALVDTTVPADGTLDAGGNVEGAAGIDCGTGGTTCASSPVLTGSTLTVLETPDAGFVFNGWSGACSGTDNACTVELSESKAVGASWSQSSSNTPKVLTVTISGSGTVEGGGIDCTGPATCTRPIPSGMTVTLSAAPKEGFVFTGWTGTASCTGTGTTCTLTMDVDRSVTATFTAAVPLSVQVNGNGSVTGGTGVINCGNGATVCTGTFAPNATVTLIASITTGATFAGWSGACGGTTTTCTVLMSAAKSVTATFTGGTPGGTTGLTLTVAVTGNGTVTGGGINCGAGGNVCSSSSNAANSTVTLTATPTGGATFGGWGGACSGMTPTCTVQMSSARSVSATFLGGTASFRLSVTVTGAGRVTGGGISCGNGASTCSANAAAGSTVTLTATPASGATFTRWSGACTGTARTCTVTMSAAMSVTAAFTGAATPGTLTLVVNGRGRVSTSAGPCAATGPQKTCVQRFNPGARVTLTATPAAGASFLAWSGGCTGTRATCTVTLSVARTVTARFSGATGAAPGSSAVLRSLRSPVVARAGAGFRVTLRFTTTAGGVARVRGLRAGRVAASLSLRVAAGRATIGPFPVARPGLYTFEVKLAGRTIRWRACLGFCGAAATAAHFLLTRQPPAVTRTGDVWSVTLRSRANQISDARIRVYRGSRLLVNQHFLGRATTIIMGPFLLGPGSYTLRLTATDPYGRTRTLSWIVALAS